MPPKTLLGATAAAFALSALFAVLDRRVGLRLGLISRPRKDRWAKRPVPLLGGVAIFAGFAAALAGSIPLEPKNLWSIALCGGLVLSFGLLDDAAELRPATKLAAQAIAACAAIFLGHKIVLFGWGPADVLLSLFWIVAVMNAFNFIDGMDGLAAGIGIIALGCLASVFVLDERWTLAVISMALLGGLLGFLLHNFSPARIYMGDSGSSFVGFALAVLSLHAASRSGVLSAVSIPVMVLGIPLLDTALVSVTRLLTNRPLTQGGTDHTPHRLAHLGFSERQVVSFLWALSLLSGASAVWISRSPNPSNAVVLLGIVIGFGLLGAYLSQAEDGAVKARGMPLVSPAFVRRLLQIALDAVVVVFCYYLAHALRFDFSIPPVFVRSMTVSLPLVLLSAFAAFLVSGIYQGFWRFTGLQELGRFSLATALAVVFGVFLVVLTARFKDFSRSIFLIYGLLLFLSLALTRLSGNFLEALVGSLRSSLAEGARTVIYGAGETGERMLREIKSAGDPWRPIGFLDDDRETHNRSIHGVAILGGSEQLGEIYRRTPFEQLIIAARKVEARRLRGILRFCKSHDIVVRRFAWTSRKLA